MNESGVKEAHRAAPEVMQRPFFGLKWPTLGILLLFPALAGLLFRGHLFGYQTYLGNSDRLNGHLKVLKYHVTSLVGGKLSAWNEHEMLGYDTFALPYTFPNPLTYLTWWFGPEHVYISAGYVSLVLFAIGGIAAYLFLFAVTRNRLASLVGGILYQLSELSVLKISQNDMSFVAFILIPLVALLIHQANRRNAAGIFVITSCLVFILMHFSFLQKTAYAMLFLGLYALYRSWNTREALASGLFFSSTLIALIAASPRIYGVGQAAGQYARVTPGIDISTFNNLYEFQNIRPYEILRWFDGSIFGAYQSAAMELGNNINLSEGFLLFTAPLTPFLIAWGVLRYRRRWFGALYDRKHDCAFHVWILLLCLSVILFKPVLHLLYLFFLRIDFTHARILIVGLLSLVALVAIFLNQLRAQGVAATFNTGTLTAALLAGVLFVLGIEIAASWAAMGWSPVKISIDRAPPLSTLSIYVNPSSLVRIGIAAAAILIIAGIVTLARAKSAVIAFSYYMLCVILVAHTMVLAEMRVNGPQTQSHNPPFDRGNMYVASRADFIPPSPAQLSALHGAIKASQYRTVLICDPKLSSGFCAGHVPEFWQLRAVDGYYGLGVPKRIALLPWPTGFSLRSIFFTSADQLPWPLLGLMNVKFALVVGNHLYRNAPGAEAPENIRILLNPTPVIPRAFFARSIRGVSKPEEAVELLTGKEPSFDPLEQSLVEGIGGMRNFGATRGPISISGGGDELDITVEPSSFERFLVLNELYFPGWGASVDGKRARIYPTNSFMRGIVVPPGATSISLRYVPIVRTAAAYAIYAAGFLLLIAGWFAWRRLALGLRPPRRS